MDIVVAFSKLKRLSASDSIKTDKAVRTWTIDRVMVSAYIDDKTTPRSPAPTVSLSFPTGMRTIDGAEEEDIAEERGEQAASGLLLDSFCGL